MAELELSQLENVKGTTDAKNRTWSWSLLSSRLSTDPHLPPCVTKKCKEPLMKVWVRPEELLKTAIIVSPLSFLRAARDLRTEMAAAIKVATLSRVTESMTLPMVF